MFKSVLSVILICMIGFTFIGCEDGAAVAKKNLTKAADNFEINRRVVFYNGITDTYILSIEGRCSVDFGTDRFDVICKVGPEKFKRHFLGRSDNTFPFVEQLGPAKASVYHYDVTFKPQTILPNINFKSSITDKK